MTILYFSEYQTGKFTAHIKVEAQKDKLEWARRALLEVYTPGVPQLVSEYSQQISRGADMIRNSQYQLKLTKAKQWFKGQRVEQ